MRSPRNILLLVGSHVGTALLGAALVATALRGGSGRDSHAQAGTHVHVHPHSVAATIEASNPAGWDAQASEELAQTLHKMHEVWNGDGPEALKDFVVGDPDLVTFELEAGTHRPILLHTKSQLDRFVDDVFAAPNTGAKAVQVEMPIVNCKATKSFGVCTEQCTVHTRRATDSVTEKLWSTSVAVRYPGGWKWVQWHMSVAAPPAISMND
jgi:hypothetical protein